jgi:Uma2 family endonuclease
MPGSLKITRTTKAGMDILRKLLDYAKSSSPNPVQIYRVDGTYVLHAGEHSNYYWREPDAAGLSAKGLRLPDGYRAPHLVVESARSVEELASYTRKPGDYLTQGSQQVWQVIAGDRVIIVHESGQPPRNYGLGDTLPGGDLLPGFTLDVAAVFEG